MAVVAAMLGIPELVSKLVAAVVAIVAAILTAAGALIKWFNSNIVQTELGDGWVWTWGYGSWWIFRWWRQSYGAWRDWGWTFIAYANTGSVENGGKDPFDWWSQFWNKPITIWYRYDESRSVYTEVKSAPTSAIVR